MASSVWTILDTMPEVDISRLVHARVNGRLYSRHATHVANLPVDTVVADKIAWSQRVDVARERTVSNTLFVPVAITTEAKFSTQYDAVREVAGVTGLVPISSKN
jgi:hypothetical protein